MKPLLLIFFILSLNINCYSQWTEQSSGVSTTLWSISAYDDNNVWACGLDGKVLRTTNGGTNWNVNTVPGASELYVIFAIDANTALVSGTGGSTKVYKTTNAGSTWEQVFIQYFGFITVIAKIQTTTPKIMLIGDPVGLRWSLWLSSDMGSTFDSTGFLNIQQVDHEGGVLNCYDYYKFPDGSDFLWFGTANSRIYRIKDGASFTSEALNGPSKLKVDVLKFDDGVNGFAGGTAAMMSNDSGNTWVAKPLPGTGRITGMVNSLPYSYYCRGSSIYISSNGGMNWSLQYSAPGGLYYHMAKGQNYIWAIRDDGGISRLTNPIGIQNTGSGVPYMFRLGQNYPNPFNPLTSFEFDVPVSSEVKIVITDILGMKIEELVNRNLAAGKYMAKWDGRAFSSGIYFVQMSTGRFNDTKKIVLLK